MFEHGRETLRIRQCKLNRQAHIRNAELCDDRAVNQLNHGMDHTLRVDHNLNVIRRHAEQMHGLDKFQTLVHHRGAVDGDFCPHIPVRMADCLLRRDVFQLASRSAAEGAAGTGEQDFLQLTLFSPHQALEDRGMLTVNRDDFRAALRGPLHDQRARADQRLLIGKGDSFLFPDGSERRLKADGTGNCGDDTVATRKSCCFCQALHPGNDTDVQIGNCGPKSLRSFFIINRNQLGVKSANLLFQQIRLPVGCQCCDTDACMLCHGKRLPADGAGTSEYRQGLNHSSHLRNACLSGGTPQSPCPVLPYRNQARAHPRNKTHCRRTARAESWKCAFLRPA